MIEECKKYYRRKAVIVMNKSAGVKKVISEMGIS
jgi:hypothetical protein